MNKKISAGQILCDSLEYEYGKIIFRRELLSVKHGVIITVVKNKNMLWRNKYIAIPTSYNFGHQRVKVSRSHLKRSFETVQFGFWKKITLNPDYAYCIWTDFDDM